MPGKQSAQLRFCPRHLRFNIEKSATAVSLQHSLKGRQIGKAGCVAPGNRESIECGIVTDNGNTVASEADIEFESIASMLQREIKGGESVLRNRRGTA